MLQLEDLPLDVFRLILSRLSLSSLSTLSQCSKAIRELVLAEGFKQFYLAQRYDIRGWPVENGRTRPWNWKLQYAVAVDRAWHSTGNIFQPHCIAPPWLNVQSLMPQVKLSESGDILGWTFGDRVILATLPTDNYLCIQQTLEARHPKSSDVECFQMISRSNGTHLVISGGSDGRLRAWSFDSHQRPKAASVGRRLSVGLPMYDLPGHRGSLKALASTPSMAITTAFDKSVKIWNMSGEEPSITDTYDIEDLGRDRPWCLAYMTHHATIALGVTQITKASVKAPLRLLQVTESGIRETANLTGHRTSIYALQALSPHTFASASYDGTARLWDIRTGSAVAVLEDPDDYPVFSLTSDAGERYLVTGTARYGVVRAYSLAYLRQSSRGTAPVKTMFMVPRTRASVYSLTMDHSRIIAGLDNQVSMLYIPSGSDNRVQ